MLERLDNAIDRIEADNARMIDMAGKLFDCKLKNQIQVGYVIDNQSYLEDMRDFKKGVEENDLKRKAC